MKLNNNKKAAIVLAVLLCALIAFIGCGFYNELRVQAYELNAEGIESRIRFAVISDLHSCDYGDDIVNAVNALKPDAVLLTGDIFDEAMPDDNARELLSHIADKYPCYYVTGNHEYWSEKAAFQRDMRILKQYGVIRLSAAAETVTINGEEINIAGVDDPIFSLTTTVGLTEKHMDFNEQLKQVAKLTDNGNYTVLLSHHPELLDEYAKYGFDLVICGHAHGGQWRLPGILNGLYAPDQGFFPKYAGGKYVVENTTMIVSRGLSKEDSVLPRFYNRPEVVAVDIY